ncbi:MAG: hypothetical protein HZY76_06165 [Anaerolineae bacterium]|nr:MAG: hypothetical protein HZY76_06165 [Anaerolineae bacterium]
MAKHTVEGSYVDETPVRAVRRMQQFQILVGWALFQELVELERKGQGVAVRLDQLGPGLTVLPAVEAPLRVQRVRRTAVLGATLR